MCSGTLHRVFSYNKYIVLTYLEFLQAAILQYSRIDFSTTIHIHNFQHSIAVNCNLSLEMNPGYVLSI